MKIGLALSGVLLMAASASAQPRYLVVDLSDAYTHSTALAGLIAQVDEAFKSMADQRRPEVLSLRAQIAELKKQAGDTREAQLALARRIEAIETAAEHDEELLAAANQSAIAKVNEQIAKIKSELTAETGARGVLDVQETLYVREGCACDYTQALYARLNAQLPRVAIDFQPHSEAASP